MLKRAKIPDLRFCGCRIYLETRRSSITETDIQEYARIFADVAAESERNRVKAKRFYKRRGKEVLGSV